MAGTQPKKQKKPKGSIRFKEARAALKQRSLLSRIFDVFRRAKHIEPTPTQRWAKDPSRFDVKGLDDASDAAKSGLKEDAHAYFSKIGRKGAHRANAKAANQYLRNDTDLLKRLLQEKREHPEREEEIAKRIKRVRDRMIRNQTIVAKKNDN